MIWVEGGVEATGRKVGMLRGVKRWLWMGKVEGRGGKGDLGRRGG